MKKLLLFVAAMLTASIAMAASFNVTVPSGTKAVYLCGDGSSWSHVEMTLSGTTATYSDDATWTEYKYCSGPSWDYVEKAEDGSEMSNRVYTDGIDVVAKWDKIYDPGATHEYKDMSVYVKNEGYSEILIWDWAGGSQRNPAASSGDFPGDRSLDLSTAGWGFIQYTQVEDAEMKCKLIYDGTEGVEITLSGEKVCIDVDGNSVECPTTDADEVVAGEASKAQIISEGSFRYILMPDGSKYDLLGQPIK